MKLASIRKEYSLQSLEINQVAKDPFLQFSQWLKEAVEAEVLKVNVPIIT
jgi:pyridoxamine 5'-phosphate oxidase